MKERKALRLKAALDEAAIKPHYLTETLTKSLRQEKPKTFEDRLRHLKMEELTILLTL